MAAEGNRYTGIPVRRPDDQPGRRPKGHRVQLSLWRPGDAANHVAPAQRSSGPLPVSGRLRLLHGMTGGLGHATCHGCGAGRQRLSRQLRERPDLLSGLARGRRRRIARFFTRAHSLADGQGHCSEQRRTRALRHGAGQATSSKPETIATPSSMVARLGRTCTAGATLAGAPSSAIVSQNPRTEAP
jgi:hypothetical protein